MIAFLIIFLSVVITLTALYVLSTVCRKGHPGLEGLRGWSFAHRGLHGIGIPENSMRAFRKAKEAGFGIELDVHLLADGNLAVIHDASLKRTADADVKIEDLKTSDLNQYYLEGTLETIPLLDDVLVLFRGEAPLIIELKCERNNHVALCESVCKKLDHYKGAYCLESFDPRCIHWLKKHRSDLIRGQLAENYCKSKFSLLPWILKFVLSYQLLNFLTRPDFVAYDFKTRKNIGNTLSRKLWKAQGVTWTINNKEDYLTAVEEGWIPIFEGFVP